MCVRSAQRFFSDPAIQKLTGLNPPNKEEGGITMSNTPPQASIVPRIGVAVFILHPVPTPPTTRHTSSPCSPEPQQQYKFVLGERLGSHGPNTWALPGGHLEFGESFEECAMRETREETDLEIEDLSFLTATNDLMPSKKEDGVLLHYATVFMVARIKTATATATATTTTTAGNGDIAASCCGMPEVKVMEPDKCAGWEWVSWDELQRWAAAQISRDAATTTAATAATGLGFLNGFSAGARHENVGEQHQPRQLFTPMVNLLVQRPGIVPRVPDQR